jgi:hypothetical protein
MLTVSDLAKKKVLALLDSQGRQGSALRLAIAGRGRCLLILDNFEQIVEHARAVVGRWLRRRRQRAALPASPPQPYLRRTDSTNGALALQTALRAFAPDASWHSWGSTRTVPTH